MKPKMSFLQHFYINWLCHTDGIIPYDISNERQFYSEHFELSQVQLGTFITKGKEKTRKA